ncbi:JAB domain-containing protein [Flavobacterium sp.]|uniref:JAB domain-containing protein n=1 Tax=Flavobacterium sp. TaxID=239 RepID=UPI0039E2D177
MGKLKDGFNKVTEVELIYRNKMPQSEQRQICSSLDAYELLDSSWDKGKMELQEQFKIMLLDRKNSCLGVSLIATGGVSECMVDSKILFATALKARASGIILAHNHPSGAKKFSDADKSLTRKFAEAAKLLDINILDHLVLTADGYVSLSDQGEMPAIHLKL